MVRLQSGFRLETISRGNMVKKKPAVNRIILPPVAIKARFSWRCFKSMALANRRAIASTNTTISAEWKDSSPFAIGIIRRIRARAKAPRKLRRPVRRTAT